MATQYDIFNASGIKIRELVLTQTGTGDYVLEISNTKLNIAKVGDDGRVTLSDKAVGLQSAGSKLFFLEAPIGPDVSGFDFDLRFSLNMELHNSFGLTPNGNGMDMRIGGDDFRFGRFVSVPLHKGVNVQLETASEGEKIISFLRITGNF